MKKLLRYKKQIRILGLFLFPLFLSASIAVGTIYSQATPALAPSEQPGPGTFMQRVSLVEEGLIPPAPEAPKVISRCQEVPINFEEMGIYLTPRRLTMTAGESQAFTVITYNEKDEELEVTCQATFFVVAEAGGSWKGNEYTAENVGTWRIVAEYEPVGYGCTPFQATLEIIVEAGAEETATGELQEITPIGADTGPKWLPIPIGQSVLPEG